MERQQRYMIMNGVIMPHHHIEGLYIFQDMHAYKNCIREVKRHIELLNNSAKQLFGWELKISATHIEQQALELLCKNKIQNKGSVRVQLKVDGTGNYRLESDAPSIYTGYVLRSIRPTATYVGINTPLPQHTTSAVAHTLQLCDTMAQMSGYRKGIACDAEGVIQANVTTPLIAIGGRTVLTSPLTLKNVVGELTLAAAKQTGYTIRIRELTKKDLLKAEELVVVDWQGLTAIDNLDNRVYNYIAAELLAQQMEMKYNK